MLLRIQKMRGIHTKRSKSDAYASGFSFVLITLAAHTRDFSHELAAFS